MVKGVSKYFKGDKVIWAVVIALFVVSLIVVYSASGSFAYMKAGSSTYYFFRHAKFLLIGLFITYFTHRIPYIYFSKLALLFYKASIPLLVITLFLGVSINSASRWLTIPGLGIEFQTSDLAKIALIMYVARLLAQNQTQNSDPGLLFKQIIVPVLIICCLILPANFSTAAILFGTCWVLMFVGRVDKKYLIRSVLVILGMGVFLIILVMSMPGKGRIGTWKNRIENYVSGDSKSNHQADQAKIAIATGGLTGKGPGNSTQRNFLPQAFSDFIYAIIVEEYGIVGGIFILLLYLYLLFRTGMLAKKSSRSFATFVAIGLTLSLVIQAMTNMAVAVGIFPVTGQTLPLISMGGTSILFTSLALGIILSVSRSVNESFKAEEGAIV